MNEKLKKQAAEQAPIPPPAYIRDMVEEAEKPLGPGEQRDKLMIDFAKSEAWKLMKRHIESKLQELAGGLREVSDGTHALDEVGYRYMVADQVNKFASQLISFVETPLKLKQAEQDIKH